MQKRLQRKRSLTEWEQLMAHCEQGQRGQPVDVFYAHQGFACSSYFKQRMQLRTAVSSEGGIPARVDLYMGDSKATTLCGYNSTRPVAWDCE